MDKNDIILNEFQTPIEELGLEKLPDEIQEQFWDFFFNVPFIQTLVSETRLRAKDLPRDNNGKIIVDITKPHILEDMDYFRPAAIHFQKYGCYTNLRPNGNPNSEFGRWIKEEVRRCREGYVRESDGEWITGDYYYFLNYAPMQQVKKDEKKSKKGKRVFDFPKVWEGHYLKFHALEQARAHGHHYAELASRSKGKSYCAASMLAKRFIMGEYADVNKKVTCYITADDKKYLVAGDQTLDKFQFDIDWMAEYMELPSMRLQNSLTDMKWTMGYKDTETGTNMGTLNSVIGVTSKDDPAKLRGSRGVLYIIEEFGTFPALEKLWGNLLPSVEEGEDVFGLIAAYGTAGDNESDFSSAQKLVYNPSGYHIEAFPNVYDKVGQGKKEFAYFFPGYLNLANCYDDNGVSDVTKALLVILKDRYQVKYNTPDINAITKRIAEIPITPQEAMLRTTGNIFPISQLNERLNEIDNNPNFYDDVYVGTLKLKSDNTVEFVPTNDIPIREFPLQDNNSPGALEIYEMPVMGPEGKKPIPGRYIVGHDPVDQDKSGTLSLTSTFVLDLFTDRIVAEWTGRMDYADDNFEMVRLLCLFYNAKCCYENNKRGLYAYFSTRRSLHLLCDTPEYLIDKQIIKTRGVGNSSKGINATTPINDYADRLIREWMIKPVVVTVEEDVEKKKKTIPNLFFIKSRALLKEGIGYNKIANFDRIRALGMVMLYRGEFMDLYEGNLSRVNDNLEHEVEDEYFQEYDQMMQQFENS